MLVFSPGHPLGNRVGMHVMPNSDLPVTFGREVRRRRTARNLTLEQFANSSGLTPNFIGTVENGKRDPSLSTILALAKGLRATPGELFGSMPDITVAAEEAGRLYDRAPPQVQKAILAILRSMVKKP